MPDQSRNKGSKPRDKAEDPRKRKDASNRESKRESKSSIKDDAKNASKGNGAAEPSSSGDAERKASSRPRARAARHVKNTANRSEVIIPPDTEEPEPSTGMVEISDPAPQIKRRQLYKENPRVYYPNVDSLSRPSHLPHSARIMISAIIGVAVVVAVILLFLYYDAASLAPEREQEKVTEAIAEAKDLDLPNLLSMVDKSNQQVFDELQAEGGNYYEKVAVSESSEQCEIIKLPDDISVAEASVMYLNGISKLSTLDAIRLLDGSWDLDLDRRSGENISLHYVDFGSGSLEEAIKQAKIEEGLDRGTETDSGDDDGLGNTFAEGTVMISGATYSWKVAAVKLTSYYSLSKIPDSVAYVGIRIKSMQS